jgi:hypothetical protein
MCFEFEALYWAMMAEEEENKRKEAEKLRDAVPAKPREQTAREEEVQPA